MNCTEEKVVDVQFLRLEQNSQKLQNVCPLKDVYRYVISFMVLFAKSEIPPNFSPVITFVLCNLRFYRCLYIVAMVMLPLHHHHGNRRYNPAVTKMSKKQATTPLLPWQPQQVHG